MRGLGRVVLTLCLVTCTVLAQSPGPEGAATVLAVAREALGGEKKLAAVKTLIATGRTRQVRGNNLVPIEFEIVVELPDKYVRRDEIPAQESDPTTVGFNGDALIQFPIPTPPQRAGGPPPPTEAQLEAGRQMRLANVRQDFARLALGLFATSFASAPLTFSYFGKAEAPQGKADALDFKGGGAFSGRLFINADTHLPIMVTWQPPTSPQRGRGPVPGPGPVAPPIAGGTGPAQSGPALESRLYYADYRDVSGVQFPFRLRRAVGPDTVEETTFDSFKINAKVDPRKFEIRK
jgi:hypothetical protein